MGCFQLHIEMIFLIQAYLYVKIVFGRVLYAKAKCVSAIPTSLASQPYFSATFSCASASMENYGWLVGLRQSTRESGHSLR